MNKGTPVAAVSMVIAAVACLAMHDAIARQMVYGLPLAVVIWVRYLSQACVVTASIVASPAPRAWRCNRPFVHLLRAAFLVLLSLTFMGGLRYVPLAESTALLFCAPLFVLLLSRLIFKERVRPIQWIAVAAGLAGVWLVVNPDAGQLRLEYLWPCAGAFFLCCYQLSTRVAAGHDNAASATLWLGVFATLICSFLAPWYWVDPTANQWLGLASMGLIGSLAHWLFAAAYAKATPAALSPYTYIQILFSSLLGFVFFSTAPSLQGWVGIALILASGMLVALPNMLRNKRLSSRY